MARRIDPEFGPCDSVLFLALRWGGGQAEDLAALINLYDWINRDIPSAEALDGGLNRLMAAGLVAERGGKFYIPGKVVSEFDAFRKRRRRDRFDMAEDFVQAAGPLKTVPRRITIREADQQRACDEYHRRFEDALRQLGEGSKGGKLS
jgi:hypothetical protein